MSENSISGHLLNLASYYIYVSWCVWNPKETLNDTLNEPKETINENLKKT